MIEVILFIAGLLLGIAAAVLWFAWYLSGVFRR
jgi:hypothetical protein